MQNLRVTLDTNVLISGLLFPVGPPKTILDTWKRNAFTLIMSSELIEECWDVLRRTNVQKQYHANLREIEKVMWLIREKSFLVEPKTISSILIRDPKDVMVLSTAIVGNADYLVTGDKDLLILEKDPAIKTLSIVTPASFLSVLRLT